MLGLTKPSRAYLIAASTVFLAASILAAYVNLDTQPPEWLKWFRLIVFFSVFFPALPLALLYVIIIPGDVSMRQGIALWASEIIVVAVVWGRVIEIYLARRSRQTNP